jgi:hypothetical protein
VICSLYEEQLAVINRGGNEEELEVRKGVWQGCALSPKIFNVRKENVLKAINERKDTMNT